MNANGLLAIYDRVADAPDATNCLRRFVLDLAVRGKLVGQHPADEPASELLKRIAAEKERLVRIGKIRKQRFLPPVEEPPFPVPQTWLWVPIREVTSDRGQNFPEAPFTYIDVSAIDKENGLVLDPKVLQPSEAPSRARKIVQQGDVIYSCVRPYLLNVAIITNHFDPAPIASTAFAILNGHGLVLPRYLWITLRSPFMIACVEERQRGQSYPAINDADFALLPFPLPPLSEQHRIVSKVDELVRQCDRLEEARTARKEKRTRLTKATLARLSTPDADASTFRSHARFAIDVIPVLTSRADQVNNLRQTILTLAGRGKLVKQNSADEPASELLKRIESDKAVLKRETGDRRIKLAPDPQKEDYPACLPATWQVQSFENLFLFIDYRGKTPPKTKLGIPLITAKNVRFGVLNRNPREFIDEKTYSAWMTRGLPKRGDLFLTTEAPMGNVCQNDIVEPFALAQRVICLQPYGEINTRFLMFAIMSNVTQTLISENSTGLTAKGIKSAKLKPLPLPVPPIEEQRRIAAKVDELMALCERLEAGLGHVSTIHHRALKSVLHKAMREVA